MMNSDIYSTVLTGHKLIVIVCDNGGYAVIDRLQNFKGSKSFNNLIADSRIKQMVEVDFAAHAASMGAIALTVHSIGELESAIQRAKKADRTTVIVTKVQVHEWTPGDSWWETGVPEVSTRKQVRSARADHDKGKSKQRVGV
jgi:3D-(3,5/4)-trihydroxycyclohexane-1,2-dione acylhydrolase (decyclizing)